VWLSVIKLLDPSFAAPAIETMMPVVEKMEITGAQIRAARAFLGWTAAVLAEKAGVSVSTVAAVERADGEPIVTGGVKRTLEYRQASQAERVEKIRATLIAGGITFLPDSRNGRGLRGRIKI
jgi:predicted transcriptional regulator